MGARLVARILAQLELQKVPLPKLTRVIFAAADLNQDELRELWPRLGPLPAKRWMLYTSANDFALRASSLVHDRPPVGSSRERVFSIDQAETVDASAVAAQLKGYGHSYVIDNPLLQADLRLWIVQGNSASERGLTPGSRPPAVFWELPR
jgi:esterase/lipase superfamily enzyme